MAQNFPTVRYAQDGRQTIVKSFEELEALEALEPAVWKGTPNPDEWAVAPEPLSANDPQPPPIPKAAKAPKPAKR